MFKWLSALFGKSRPVAVVAVDRRPIDVSSVSGAPPFRVTAHDEGFSTFGLIYRDGAGERTERVVTLGHIGEFHIVAFCHLRRAVRTFRRDRIFGGFHPETGVVFKTLTISPLPVAEFAAMVLDVGVEEFGAPFAHIAGAQALFEPELSALGWTLHRAREGFRETLGLHRRSKRGDRVLKRASAALAFEPIFDDGRRTESGAFQSVPGRTREKPWYVSGPAFGESFARAGDAASAFRALALDPATMNPELR